MGDKKISELTALTSPDGAEELVVNDGGTSKKITIDDLFAGDNVKANFGAGNDLQIYHDGSKSIIHDNGAGQLLVRTNQFNVNSADNTEKLLEASQNAQVDLYYNNSKKLATTSTGINVTGTVTADGLTVENGVSRLTASYLAFSGQVSTPNEGSAIYRPVADAVAISTNTKQRFLVGSGGDISFYEDTGTTAKLFWDASAESLGIGTSSPVSVLHTNNSSNADTTGLTISNYDNTAGTNQTTRLDFGLSRNSGALKPYAARIQVGKESDWTADDNNIDSYMAFSTYKNNSITEAMRIDSSGNVGIGTDSPSNASLDVVSNATASFQARASTAGVNDGDTTVVVFRGVNSTGGKWSNAVYRGYSHAWSYGSGAGSNEAMRIDSSGNVGIGVVPTQKLQVDGNIRIGDTAVGSGDNEDYSITTGGQLLIKANDGAADVSYTALRLASGSSGGASAANSVVLFELNDTERMRIDSSGNVGIGCSPAQTLHLKSADPVIRLEDSSPDGVYAQIDGAGGALILSADGGAGSASSFIGFRVDGTALGNEAMRIDSSGNVLVGTTSSSGQLTVQAATASDSAAFFKPNVISSGAGSSAVTMQIYGQKAACLQVDRYYTHGSIMAIKQNGSPVGSISVTSSATSYNTSSDYRLKTDVQPITGATERLKALKPVNFEWIADGTRVDGFLAHEAQEVVPEAISGEKDAMKTEEYEVTPAVEATYDDEGNELTPAVEAVMGEREVPEYQGIDQSKLVPLLTAALQEAVAKIETLETRITALEANQ